MEDASLTPDMWETRLLLTDRLNPPELLDTCYQLRLHWMSFGCRRTMKTAKRGAAGGRSGVTTELLCPLLDYPKDSKLLFKMAEGFAGVLEAVIQTITMGRMTALRKQSADDVIEKVKTRAMTHMFCKDCASWRIIAQSFLDGMNANNLVFRAAFFVGLLNRVGGGSIAVCVYFPRIPWSYMCENSDGVEHSIRQYVPKTFASSCNTCYSSRSSGTVSLLLESITNFFDP